MAALKWLQRRAQRNMREFTTVLIRQYLRGAKNATSAGFDGLEVHGANGYLLDQFINSTTNRVLMRMAARSKIGRDCYWKLSGKSAKSGM